jgi:hypothetical protein
MLATLEDLDPAEQQPGRWRLFELDGPVLLVAAVCRSSDRKTDSPGTNGPIPAERVVSWGLGLRGELPVAKAASGWTLLVCDATADRVSAAAAMAAPSLPPSSRRTLSLAVSGGGWMVGFRRSGSAVASQQFFDDWSAAAGWPQASRWQQLGNARHARYGEPRRGWIDVQLLGDAADSHCGVLAMTPPNTIVER